MTLTTDEIAASPPPLSRVPPCTHGRRLALLRRLPDGHGRTGAARPLRAPRRAARLRETGGGGRQVAARQARARGLHPAPPRQRPLPPRQREVPPLEQRRQHRRLGHRQHDDSLGHGAHPVQGGHA